MAAKRKVEAHRVYDAPDGGYRVLVDRVWPRGLNKDKAHLDEWCKDVAPSTELRRWYAHDPDKFAEFQRRYRAELDGDDASAALDHLRSVARSKPVVLLTASRALDISQAAVLAGLLR